MILETLPFSFRMEKEILKDYKVFIWKSKILQVLIARRRKTIPNKESSREGIRKQAQGQVIHLRPFRTLEKECLIYLKEKESIHHFLIEFLVVDCTIYGG